MTIQSQTILVKTKKSLRQGSIFSIVRQKFKTKDGTKGWVFFTLNWIFMAFL